MDLYSPLDCIYFFGNSSKPLLYISRPLILSPTASQLWRLSLPHVRRNHPAGGQHSNWSTYLNSNGDSYFTNTDNKSMLDRKL